MQIKIWIFVVICTLGASFQTAAQTPKLDRLGPELEHPWGMDFLDDNHVLVTERVGGLHLINLSSGMSSEVSNLPKVVAKKQGGLLDVLVHDETIFLCYSKKQKGGVVTAIDGASLRKTALENRQTIFTTNAPSNSSLHFGCRLAVQDGYIFASFGDRGSRENAQNPESHDGSIIRLHLDGTIPAGNPQREGWAKESYSIGHRNPQGLAIHPETGAIWSHEHGPKGGDEINIIAPGANYGWPVVSHGREYMSGRKVSKYDSLPGYADPKWVWVPSIAPSGMAFYPARDGASDMFPELNGSLLVGSLKFRRLYQVMLDEGGLPRAERVLIDKSLGRIRDVAVAKDGSILLLNDAGPNSNPPGGLYRVSR